MINNRINKKQLKEFGILLGFGFPIIIGLIIPILVGHPPRIWTLWLGIIFLIFGFIKPDCLYYPYRLWMMIGHLLGWINSRLILGVIFFVILMPISFIMKLFSYDPLKIKKNNCATYRLNKKDYSINLNRIF